MDHDETGSPQGGGDSTHAALARLSSMRDAARAQLEAPLWSLSDAQSRDAVRDSHALLQQAYAVYLRTIEDLDARPDAVTGARSGAVAKTYLVHGLHVTRSQAGADVGAAHALSAHAEPAAGGLLRLGAALAAGEVSREHARVAVSAMNQLPRKLLREPLSDDDLASLVEAGVIPAPGDETHSDDRRIETRGDLVDHLVTEHSKASDPGTVDQLGKRLLNAADPDGSRSFDPDATQRRGLSLHQDPTGMEIVRGELDPATAALVKAALDAFSKPNPTRTETAEDGTVIEIKDRRTGRQRLADAWGVMARLAMGAVKAGSTRGGEPPRVVLHARPADVRAAHAAEAGSAASAGRGADLGTGGHVDPFVLGRLSCDAVLQKAMLAPSGAFLNLGRDVRTVSAAQRRALTARDRGCVVPSCTAPAHWCEGHHVRWWRHDGRTDIDNLALTCGHHHTLIHQGVWGLTMRDGVPWAIPPPWVDVKRRPIRNTYWDDVEKFHRLGTQLRLGFDLPSSSDPPDGADPPDESQAA